MAEDAQEQEAASGRSADAAGIAADPAAISLALAGASRAEADAYLQGQCRLTALQIDRLEAQDEHFQEEAQLELQHLRWRGFTDRMKGALQVMTVLVGLTVAGALGLMVWDASQSRRLIIEPFSVPPDMAQNGLTGETVAAKLLDHLATMQAQTNSTRAAKTYLNNWSSQDIKVAIPETGISLAELDNFLRGRFGNDTHINGEVVRSNAGLMVSARTDGSPVAPVEGPEAEFDGIVQRLGEAIYRQTQPFRYGIYLASHRRASEAVQVLDDVARSGSKEERPWGYFGLGMISQQSRGIDPAIDFLTRAIAVGPAVFTIRANLGSIYSQQGHPETALEEFKKALASLSASGRGLIREDLVPAAKMLAEASANMELGAFHDAAADQAIVVDSPYAAISPGQPAQLALALAGEHAITAARQALVAPEFGNGVSPGYGQMMALLAVLVIAKTSEDWHGLVDAADKAGASLAAYPGVKNTLPGLTVPLTAFGEAKLGQFGAAEGQISHTPADCYRCLIARAQIADMQGQQGRADWWFDRSVKSNPSIPFAHEAWGQALLARGDADGAIAKFTLANSKGPRFADPLEGWAEALMAKSQSHLAVTKFAAAEKFAPNWGRLQLKWAEALTYAGKPAEAAKHFARADALDLTPTEKSERAQFPHP